MMSKLDRLIAEFCPDGVKFVPTRSIADVGTGNSDRVNADEKGTYPFYVRSQRVNKLNCAFAFTQKSHKLRKGDENEFANERAVAGVDT